jgi:hypothetical protein
MLSSIYLIEIFMSEKFNIVKFEYHFCLMVVLEYNKLIVVCIVESVLKNMENWTWINE